MAHASIVSPEDQKVTFIELFFDLVFVFSVTQTVALFHDGITLLAVGQCVLVFWLVWWGWTQFTWALNAADTTHPWIELATLAATGITFFMAAALPDAFHDRALTFAIPYVLIRIIGLSTYIWVASAHSSEHKAVVMRFAIASIAGLIAVIAGALMVGTPWQYALWGLAIVLDILAANTAGKFNGWDLHPEHFAERHGLFTIIVLGETLIVAAGGLSGVAWSSSLLSIGLLAVLITCTFWWTYYTRAKPALDHALENSTGAEQAEMARDVFSFFHFPMMLGIIAYAIVVEESVLHPEEYLHLDGRLLLAAGFLLFVGGMVLAVRRATGKTLTVRLLVSLATVGAIVGISHIPPESSLGIAFVGVLAIAIAEQRAGAVLPAALPHDEEIEVT